MSKICIVVLCDTQLTPDAIYSELSPLLNHYGLDIFFGLSYEEPLMNRYIDKNHLIFSISDNSSHNNCEMFLLPDNCSFNGNKNTVSFQERMHQLKDILLEARKLITKIELFIGDSGTQYEEFEEIHIGIQEFTFSTTSLNTVTAPDLHFYFSTGDGSVVPSQENEINPN